MKKLFATTLLLVLSLTTQAQTDVTKFLGIPVDGTKPEMIRQLKAKGFRNSPYNNEILEGEFNGSNVYVSVATNNNKVWRIMVSDATPTDVRNVQIRFNRLCKQFENNPNYVTLKDYTIPDDEDIRVQILLNKKRYEAAFYQKREAPASLIVKNAEAFLSSKYTEEQLENPTEEIQVEIFEYIEEVLTKKNVWFMISDNCDPGEYKILMFYDNKYNEANGQDL